MRTGYPDKTEAQCFEMLGAMSSADRYRILLGTYGCDDISDPGADHESYDPLRMEFGQGGVDNWGAPLSPHLRAGDADGDGTSDHSPAWSYDRLSRLGCVG
jgi:hypothetical protein